MRLADLFMPLMAFTIDFETRPRGSVDNLSNDVNDLVQELRNKGSAAGHDYERINEALFPVIAWMDERFLSLRSWDSERLWQRCLLQRYYFNTTLAGVEFFERLQKLDPKDNQLREIYLLILSLGFVGQFAREKAGAESMHNSGVFERGWNDHGDQTNNKLFQIRKSQLKQYLSHSGHALDAQEILFPFAYQTAMNPVKKPLTGLKRILSRPKHLAFLLVPPLAVLLYAIYLNASLNKTINLFLESVGI